MKLSNIDDSCKGKSKSVTSCAAAFTGGRYDYVFFFLSFFFLFCHSYIFFLNVFFLFAMRRVI